MRTKDCALDTANDHLKRKGWEAPGREEDLDHCGWAPWSPLGEGSRRTLRVGGQQVTEPGAAAHRQLFLYNNGMPCVLPGAPEASHPGPGQSGSLR